VGKTALFDLEGDWVFASYLVRIALDQRRADPEWLNYYLNWSPTQARLKALASRGVSQSNISASKLRTLMVPLPPLAEQRMGASYLREVDRKILVDERRLLALDCPFHALLAVLMTGRRRAPALDRHQ